MVLPTPGKAASLYRLIRGCVSPLLPLRLDCRPRWTGLVRPWISFCFGATSSRYLCRKSVLRQWSNGVRNRMQNGATSSAAPYAKIGHSTDRKSVGSFFRVVTLPPVCPVAPQSTRHAPSLRHTSSKCRHGAARRIPRPASTARSRRWPDRTPRSRTDPRTSCRAR